MLDLINRDRKRKGVPPVTLDPIATSAGQTHAKEMAAKGYLGHYDVLGHKPWQRYTEAGGSGYVAENTYNMHTLQQPAQLPDGNRYTVLPNPHLLKNDLEQAESNLFNEVPPNDGHRRNILSPDHDGVGIGIAVGTNGNEYIIAITQEFTDNKGAFDPLPPQIQIGQEIVVSGKLSPGYQLHGIDLKWDSPPQPMAPQEISKLNTYALPEKQIASYWPPPYQSPEPVTLIRSSDGDKFKLVIKPQPSWEAGIYYVEIWANTPEGKKTVAVSMRTMILPR